MDGLFYAITHKQTIHFFLFLGEPFVPILTYHSEYLLHTSETTPRLYKHPSFTKVLRFSQTLTITFLFHEVPVKLLLLLL